ncbi:hypothetical protein HUT06_18370 [Actinomadura sp. NAK00032]|uniref:DUF6461 domain-containing protein n=1 Tax=Actinomadura sp. NAK00032 TaxID=2742128 RepID=UPI001591B3D1|nr:DUF6461 domain-containing protein [Actinomadura sp. NAK00032]QKW35757.1 hypothetical protein HUT06_18370 [Actinomadura sp. NAK00032]
MLNVSYDDVKWAESFNEIYCFTFIKGVGETEALLRLGGLQDTFRPRTQQEASEMYDSYEAGYANVAFALDLGGWTVLIEPGGYQGALIELLRALSLGTEAVSVRRHDYADHGFGYAVDGTLVTGFEPTWPGRRWGSEPDRLVGKMRTAGLDPDLDDEEDFVSDPHVPALLLAGLITGVLQHRDTLSGRLMSAEIEPWFSAAEPWLGHGPADPEMIAALAAAPPHVLRSVAARETERLASVLHLDGTPGLAEAVAAAERGETVKVSPTSELGVHVRSWLKRAHQAGRSLNASFDRGNMTDDERTDAYMLGWFAGVLRAALWPEPHAAARAVLHPLTQGPPSLRDPAQQSAILHELRGDARLT